MPRLKTTSLTPTTTMARACLSLVVQAVATARLIRTATEKLVLPTCSTSWCNSARLAPATDPATTKRQKRWSTSGRRFFLAKSRHDT